MIDFLIYDAKVAVLIAVFYMFYRLMLSRETFHRVNRIVLLTTSVVSFVLPLCIITMHKTVTVTALPTVDVGDLQAIVVEKSQPLWLHILLPTLFIIGMVLTLGYMLLSVWRVVLLIKNSEHHPQEDGIVVCVTDNQVSPFSWMHYIVMNRQDYAEHNDAVLAHERGHIRLRHSWDVLLVDTLTGVIRGTCCSLIPSPPSNGSTPPCGCCARTCAPSTNTRPTVQYSHRGSMRVNTNTC